jgi:peptide/nickel transport system substrate-binding protein
MKGFHFRSINSFVLRLVILGLLYACARITPTIIPSPSVTNTNIPSTTLSLSTPTPESTATRTPTPAPRTLNICQGAEPDTLYIYGGNMLAANNVLEAIYDGPIDSNGFSYQPVILEKLPSLADGDATIQPVAVVENDFVLNDAGQVVLLRPSEVVRPYGCNLSDCAITWQGEPLEMAQMSAIFTLKMNIRWSDGEPLTADDSLFGFEMANGCRFPEDPNAACGTLGAGGQQTIERTASYIALDDYTTQWVGVPGFLDQAYMTNFAHPLPRHQLQGFTPQELFTAEESSVHPMGWGPYKIDKFQFGEYIRMSRNPYYFRADEGLPHFDQLIIRFFGRDEAATLFALENGACDLVDWEQASKHIPLEHLIEYGNSGQIQALITTGTTWEHLDFNIQPAQSIINSGAFAGWDLDGDGQGPFGDVRLRQAIAMCLDRQKVVDTLFFGKSPVPDTYLPPNHPLLNAQATHWQYDPAAAAALLDNIGWLDTDNDPTTLRLASGVTGVPDGTPLSMNIETTTAKIRQQVFDIFSQSLAGCGIQVNLQTYAAADFFNADPAGRVYGRLYDLAEFARLTGVTPPCDLFLSNHLPTAENGLSGQINSGFNDPVYDAACNQQLQSLPGEVAYTQAAQEAQRIFAEQLPVVPLFLQIKYAAARPDMCDYSLDPSAQSDFGNIEAFDYGVGCN